MENHEEPSRTLLCIVPNQICVDRLYAQITGILKTTKNEETGVFLFLPLSSINSLYNPEFV